MRCICETAKHPSFTTLHTARYKRDPSRLCSRCWRTYCSAQEGFCMKAEVQVAGPRGAWQSASVAMPKRALHALFLERRWQGYHYGRHSRAPVSFLIEGLRQPHSRHAPSVAYTLPSLAIVIPAVAVVSDARRHFFLITSPGSGQRHRQGRCCEKPRTSTHLRPQCVARSEGRCCWSRQRQAEARQR